MHQNPTTVTMDDLPFSILGEISEYVMAPRIPILRDVCKGFRHVLDTKSPRWEEILKTYAPGGSVGLTWDGSKGTSALMVRASSKNGTCVSCRGTFLLEVNAFYDMLVCRNCQRWNVFKVVNLKLACKEFFLDYREQKDNRDLLKYSHGRSFRVLLGHVLRVARNKFPRGELDQRLYDRRQRIQKTNDRRVAALDDRMSDVSNRFEKLVAKAPARVDSVLRDEIFLREMVHSFGSTRMIYEDISSLKITTHATSTDVAHRLCAYASMLTHMKKINLLDNDYIAQQMDTHPHYIFYKHLSGGLHYYELSQQYACASRELAQRVSDVDTHVTRNNLTSSERKSLSIAMCVEETMDYCHDEFRQFIDHNVGNPVQIARERRKRLFLNANNYTVYIDYYTTLGHHHSHVLEYAERAVLAQTKGYPPMTRGCVINLTDRSTPRGCPSVFLHEPGTFPQK